MTTLTIEIDEVQLAYLKAMKSTALYGATMAEVIEHCLLQAVRAAVDAGHIELLSDGGVDQ